MSNLPAFVTIGDGHQNRFRFYMDFEVKGTKRLAYKSFWNHRFSNKPSISEVDAFGMVLKLYWARYEKEKDWRVPQSILNTSRTKLLEDLTRTF